MLFRMRYIQNSLRLTALETCFRIGFLLGMWSPIKEQLYAQSSTSSNGSSKSTVITKKPLIYIHDHLDISWNVEWYHRSHSNHIYDWLQTISHYLNVSRSSSSSFKDKSSADDEYVTQLSMPSSVHVEDVTHDICHAYERSASHGVSATANETNVMFNKIPLISEGSSSVSMTQSDSRKHPGY